MQRPDALADTYLRCRLFRLRQHLAQQREVEDRLEFHILARGLFK